MPKRNDIKSVLIIGAGPIVIGQACEFDYSGAQACKALKEEGLKVILVNSNPATIMTDPELADVTYIEPINSDVIEKIIKIEKPNAILPTMGGQTALNIAIELDKAETLKKYKVELIGANREAIEKAEDRKLFKQSMERIGIKSPKSEIANSLDDAVKALDRIGLPAVIRPGFTLGGKGGGVAFNENDYREICISGLDASPANQILIDQSLLGWKEFEMEVIRDKNDNAIIVCSIENFDPMGVHTGDSITVAPAMTLTDKEFQKMRNNSLEVLKEIGVETGGSNVQWAVNPETGEMLIIEMNPRVSRSSALASKATGFPIAKVAAKLAIGYTLDELQNDITKTTPASFEPTIDYVVTKIPRFAFEKFPSVSDELGTSMKSVGEVMAIGATFQESMQKALNSLENKTTGLANVYSNLDKIGLYKKLSTNTPEKIFLVGQAFRIGFSLNEVNEITRIDKWFLRQIEQLIQFEKTILVSGSDISQDILIEAKSMGFSDERIAELSSASLSDIQTKRQKHGIFPVYKRIDTCGGEFQSEAAYLYSTYDSSTYATQICEAQPSKREKVIILGSGPNRIGQGIEFDYCCCHACFSLSEEGIETIMVNCNPETVSTDFDTSDKLYFEPLDLESVINIIEKERKSGKLLGVIVQYGGQTPLKLANDLNKRNIKILGTAFKSIEISEDRKLFKEVIETLDLKQPENTTITKKSHAIKAAELIKYPIIARPSFVLGGSSMEILHDSMQLKKYLNASIEISSKTPLLLDSYLGAAIEVDVDLISDGEDCFVAGIMEHIEEAGVHSGDSACSLPPHTLEKEIIERIKSQSSLLCRELNVIGLMNIQFAVKDNEIYVLEVNPRASRTVPFISKATGIPLANLAAKLMIGKKLSSLSFHRKDLNYVAVKEAVLPFDRLPGSDIILTPEMRSTGEVMGIADNFEGAFFKSQISAGMQFPKCGNVFLSIRNEDKTKEMGAACKILKKVGFKIFATRGTKSFLDKEGVESLPIKKVYEGRPNIADLLKDKKIDIVMNTTQGKQSLEDSKDIRSLALSNKIPCYTTARGIIATIKSLNENIEGKMSVKAIQKYHSQLITDL
ncbi:carbamoyl-phosphate synthase large subunit [Paracoccaceae bacterium]|nr:carbamoyl-phosphate synthase large subunit [Paracoccaceae bacterium]